jgi:exodeoxyribonuclease-3
MSLKIYSWNVNGIRAVWKKKLLLPFIDKEKPDILCMQETKATKDQTEIVVPGYMEFWNSATKKGYSGTAIFTKIQTKSVAYDFSDEINKKYQLVDLASRDSNDEGRVITAEFDKFFLVTVYTPNSKSDLSRLDLRHNHWDKAFLAHCKQLEKTKPVVFCGDLNVAHTADDIANPKPNEGKSGYTKEERQGLDNYINAGFIDSFRLFKTGNGYYTWWSHWADSRARNVGWRIDYFLVSKSLKSKIKAANIHPDIMGSDHCPVSVELDL